VFACTLSFSPQHGTKPALSEVWPLGPQADRHLFSARKPTAPIMCDNGRTAVATPAQVLVRSAAIRSQSHLRHANRFPNRLKMAGNSSDDFPHPPRAGP
jgi:hypothetical protein